MLNDCLCSRPVIDVPVDAGDDEVVATVSAKTLRTGARSDSVMLVGLAGGLIVIFTDVGVDVLVGVNANMLVATITDMEFIGTRVSLEDSLSFCC